MKCYFHFKYNQTIKSVLKWRDDSMIWFFTHEAKMMILMTVVLFHYREKLINMTATEKHIQSGKVHVDSKTLNNYLKTAYFKIDLQNKI